MGIKMQFSPNFPQLYADAVRRLDKLDRQFFYEDRARGLGIAMDSRRRRRAYDDRVLNRTGEFDNFDEMPDDYEWRRGSMNGPVTDRRRRGMDEEGYSYGAGRSPLHDYDPVSQGSENYDPPEEFEEAEDDEEEIDRRAAERQERERPQQISNFEARRMTGEDRRRRAMDKRFLADGTPRRARDEPPPFRGRPEPGGRMTGMDELRINMRRIGMDSAIGTLGVHGYSRDIRKRDRTGRLVTIAKGQPLSADATLGAGNPRSWKYTREGRAMAMDGRRDPVPSIFEMFPGIEKVGRCY
jgi:hypothetical protein